MKVTSSNPLVAGLLVMVLVCMVVVLQPAEGQSQVGQCLIGCGGSTMSCGVDCGAGRGGIGSLACYQGCATQDITCLISCFGRQILPKSKCD